MPSRAEALPYVVLEALGAGMPMIATAVGGIPEIFGNRQSGADRPGGRGPGAADADRAWGAGNACGLDAGARGARGPVFGAGHGQKRAEGLSRGVNLTPRQCGQERRLIKRFLGHLPYMASHQLRRHPMNEVDPRLRYSPDTVKNYDNGEEPSVRESTLEPLVERIADELRTDTTSPVMVSGLLRIGEFLGLSAIATTIMLSYVGTGAVWPYALTIAGGSTLFVLLNEIAEGYSMRALRRPLRWFPRVALAWAATFALLALAGFLLKTSEDFSRFWSGSWFLGGLVFLFLTRLLLNVRIRKWARDGTMERRAVIVGGGKPAEKLIRALERQHDNDIRICGIFDDRDDSRSPPIVAGYPKLGNVAELVEFVYPARPHRHADRLAAARRRGPRPDDVEETLGTAGRYPPVGAFQQAAVPATHLFLHRLGADARHFRQADHATGIRSPSGRSTSSFRCSGSPFSRRSCSRPPSPSSSTARGRCCSSRSGTASTTKRSGSTSSARCMSINAIRRPVPR